MFELVRTVLKLPFNWLPSGMMTYLAAGAIVVLALAEIGAGVDVPGFNFDEAGLEWVLVALGLGGLRRKLG
jgi:hypothetical protein